MSEEEKVIAHLQIIHSWGIHDKTYDTHRLSEESSDVERWCREAITLIHAQKKEIDEAAYLLNKQENEIDNLKTLLLGYETGAIEKLRSETNAQ